MVEMARVLEDVKSLYKETTGKEWHRADIPRSSFPEGVEKTTYMEQEINYLNQVIQGRGLSLAPTMQPKWIPPITMNELKEKLLIEIELPGIKKSDITLSLRKGFLHLQAERPIPEAKKQCVSLAAERPYGIFERQIWLPVHINPESLTARFEDGVLLIEATKEEPEVLRGKEVRIL